MQSTKITITLPRAAADELQARARRFSDASSVSVTPTQIAAGIVLAALGFRPDGSPRVDTAPELGAPSAPEQVSHTPPAEPTDKPAPVDQGPARRTRPRPIARADAARHTPAPKHAPKGPKKR